MVDASRATRHVMLTVVTAASIAFVSLAMGGRLLGPVLAALVCTGVLAIGGGYAVRTPDTSTATKWEAATHSFPLFVLLVMAYFIVPRFKRVFEGFNTELDEFTRLLIGISDLVVNYWYIVLPQLVMILGIDLFVFHLLHRNAPTRWVAKLWSVSIGIALLLVIWLSIWVLMQPMLKIQ